MKSKKNIINILIIFLVTFILLFKLFFYERFEGHDTVVHVTNIIRLSETISLDNIFGDNIITYNFNKFGNGFWLFYPKLPHLIASYIYLIVKDVYLSMNIVYFITTFLSGVFTYYLSNRIFKNKMVALLSAIFYLTFPYHMCEIYTRDAFAENFMFMVLPMIFLGLYNLKDDNYIKFYILFVLGYIIGMNSHLVSMFFYTIFIGIFILYYRKEYFKISKFKALLFSSLIVVGICLPFLTTILEHKSLGIYRVFMDFFITLDGLKSAVLDFNSLYTPKPILNKILPYFSLMTIIFLILSTIIFLFDKKKKYNKDKKILMLLIIILINVICSREIWNYVPKLFLSIQFPWRLLVFLSLILSLYSSSFFLIDKFSINFKKVIFIIVLFVSVFEGVNNIVYFKPSELLTSVALNNHGSMGYQHEYFPDSSISSKLKYGSFYYKVRDYGIIVDGDADTLIVNDDFPNMEFVVNNISGDVSIELPRVYYLGYELIDDGGNKITLYNNDNGFLSANINGNGVYKLSYVRTKLHNLALIIRLITILMVCLVLVVKFKKWRKKELQS